MRRADNIHWQAIEINKHAHAAIKNQKACILWFTGLSGAGKSTIANLVEKRLYSLGHHTFLLDGDNVRHGLNRDLGFTDADRVENIRRVAEVAKLMVEAGLIVLVSFISPFRTERRMARELVEQGEFIEVFVNTPLAVAEARDPKGLYKKARRRRDQALHRHRFRLRAAGKPGGRPSTRREIQRRKRPTGSSTIWRSAAPSAAWDWISRFEPIRASIVPCARKAKREDYFGTVFCSTSNCKISVCSATHSASSFRILATKAAACGVGD